MANISIHTTFDSTRNIFTFSLTYAFLNQCFLFQSTSLLCKLSVESKRFSERYTLIHNYPAGMYLLKVINRNTRTRCEIYSKLTIKLPEQRRLSHLSYFTPCSIVSIVNFEHVITGWVSSYMLS